MALQPTDKMVLLVLAIKKGEGFLLPLPSSSPLPMLPGNKLDYLRYHLAQRFLACRPQGDPYWMRPELQHTSIYGMPYPSTLSGLPSPFWSGPLKCNTGAKQQDDQHAAIGHTIRGVARVTS